MRNIEKYEKEVLDSLNYCNLDIKLENVDTGLKEDCDDRNCNVCKKQLIEWLLSEYKEPVLTEEEKEYLSSVIKPFRKFVVYIEKIKYIDGWEKIIFYSLNLKSWECMTNLPPFQSGTRFKGMKLNKQYKLEELGL